MHATVRAARGLPSFRSGSVFPQVSRALAASSSDRFRVIHFSVQSDHLHLIVEADSRHDLGRGLRGVGIRCARAINRALGRRGAVWAERYHAHSLRTPREVRHALVYVLLNFRKHLRAAPGIDPCSSGAWFDGWSSEKSAAAGPCPVIPARTWLATAGWRRGGGPIDYRRELPAAQAASKACRTRLGAENRHESRRPLDSAGNRG